MARSNVGTLGRSDVGAWERAVGLGLWIVALVTYFGPWIARQPMSAALAWNAYDLFDLLRFLPEIETGALTVNLQALRLPLVGLAVLPPLLLADLAVRWRVAGALLGCALAALTLPPYPQIMTAWRTPGWRVPFWWAVGACACALVAAWLAPRMGRVRRWLILAVAEVATVPAVVTLTRLLPALRKLHAAPVTPGWGFWACTVSLAGIGLTAWMPTWRTLSAETGGPMSEIQSDGTEDTLARIREVKAKYEAQLMQMANVVAVGIGVPIEGGRPKGEPGIIVSVTRKVAVGKLRPRDLVPKEIEDVRVWVEDVDRPRAKASAEPASAPDTTQ